MPISRFDDALRAARMSDLVRLLLHRPTELLPFDPVREGLKLRHFVDRGVVEVPLDRIVGTFGRHREFNRAFLPRAEALRDRWQGVARIAEGAEGFPPVELYRVGDAYFVVDGHHRVSVARSLGAPAIEARVREFLTPVPLAADETLEEVLLKSELADFLEATGLVPATPGEYRATVADGAARLLDHVSTHRYFLGLDTRREVSWPEAVASWRDRVYRPMIAAVRASGLLDDFPGATETDLYLFLMDHLHALRQRYGANAAGPARAVRHFALARKAGAGGWGKRLKSWWRKGDRRQR